jgi:hypothetical protein
MIRIQETRADKSFTWRVVVGFGSDNLGEVIGKGYEYGLYYRARYPVVDLTIQPMCAECSGTGKVPKRGRVMFATKVCPECKGRPCTAPTIGPVILDQPEWVTK